LAYFKLILGLPTGARLFDGELRLSGSSLLYKEKARLINPSLTAVTKTTIGTVFFISPSLYCNVHKSGLRRGARRDAGILARMENIGEIFFIISNI
jgi:hypothetical protein